MVEIRFSGSNFNYVHCLESLLIGVACKPGKTNQIINNSADINLLFFSLSYLPSKLFSLALLPQYWNNRIKMLSYFPIVKLSIYLNRWDNLNVNLSIQMNSYYAVQILGQAVCFSKIKSRNCIYLLFFSFSCSFLKHPIKPAVLPSAFTIYSSECNMISLWLQSSLILSSIYI